MYYIGVNKMSDSNSSGLSITYSTDRYHLRYQILFNDHSSTLLLTFSKYPMLQYVGLRSAVLHLSQQSYYCYNISSQKHVFHVAYLNIAVYNIFCIHFLFDPLAVTKTTFSCLSKFCPYFVVFKVKTISGL